MDDPHLWSRFSDKFLMRKQTVLTYLVALGGLTLGLVANPFGNSKPTMPPGEVEDLYGKARAYHEAGNYEGAIEVSRQIPKDVPRYADIHDLKRRSEKALEDYKRRLKNGEARPSTPDRLPAALRDSYYDAKLEFSRGQCREAYAAMAPVAKYLNNQQDMEIFKACLLTQRKTK